LDASTEQLPLNLQQLGDHVALPHSLQGRLRPGQRRQRPFLLVALHREHGRPDSQHPVGDQRQVGNLGGVVQVTDMVGVGGRSELLTGLLLGEGDLGPFVVFDELRPVVPPSGQPLQEPVQLGPGAAAVEEVEQIDVQLVLQVVLDGLAEAFYESDEALDPPGSLAASRAWASCWFCAVK
jgi:hypothetical protein